MKMSYIVAGLAATVFVAGLIFIGMFLSAHNREIGLRNQHVAQQQVAEANFDKAWKVIQQNAQVSTQERESFKDAYVEIMNSTQGVAGQGALASFFTQAQINMTPDLFGKLMNTIEAQRESFFRVQERLLSIEKEHMDVLTKYPSALFVGGRQPLESVIVTSSYTDEAFSTGQENDINLFGK